MRREDERLWKRVARTVSRLEDEAPRVPMAEPGPSVDGRAVARAIDGARGHEARGADVIARDRARHRGSVAAPAGEPSLHAELNALEAWWNEGSGDGAHPARPDPPARPRPFRTQPAPSHPDPLDRRTLRKLGRRRLPVEGRIDLHGLTEAAAYERLLSYLGRARFEGLRHVVVITGKGRAGKGSGVLRRAVPQWFATEPFRSLVSGYSPAARHDGGEGALYVKLKKG